MGAGAGASAAQALPARRATATAQIARDVGPKEAMSERSETRGFGDVAEESGL